MTSLDITTWKQKGRELEDEISRIVDGEAKLMHAIPSKLILTGKQFQGMTGILLPMYDPGVTKSGIIYSQSLEIINENMFLTEKGYPMELEVRDV